ncbi:MAG: hypothetical protein IJK99_09170 [Bacteroidales bacterium]|nr:hypothetical protein [Bacteroidales bacterium]
MKIKVERRWRKDTYTIGRLYVDGVFFCNTLEDKDRGLKQTDPLASIKKRKVYSETAIPIGTYTVAMDVVSPKYAAVAYYKKLNGGKMPRVLNVPGYEGILIHPGNSALDTAGCLLVGQNTVVGRLTNSRATFEKLYSKMLAAHKRGEKITIEYVW